MIAPPEAERIGGIAADLAAAWAIAKKDLVIYYLKPQIYMSGLLFPLFMLLAFAIGREASPQELVPGLLAITALFSASTIEPVSIPIERRTGTFERLLSAPIPISSIVLGESISGLLFSLSICLLLSLGGILFAPLPSPPLLLLLVCALVLSSFCFSSLGTVFAAYPTDNVGVVMSMLNVVRFPLIFISGVFIPLGAMPPWGRSIASLSPLTYACDLVRLSLGHPAHFHPALDALVLILFILAFQAIGNFLYRRFSELSG